MDCNILKSELNKQTKKFISQVYPKNGACFTNAVNTIFNGLIHGGNTLVTNLAAYVDNSKTSSKGMCERVSGWLEKYDFAGPAADWMVSHSALAVTKKSTIAVDLSDISKAFGGKGMEGMQMGYDGSRKTTAMGHTFCAAVVVGESRQSVSPLCFRFEKGRKETNVRMENTIHTVQEATKGHGILAIDRGADSERILTFLQNIKSRAVVRINTLKRDVFGNGKNINVHLDAQKRIESKLVKSNGNISAQISWDKGCLSDLHNTPMLVVRSEFADRVIYLYALPGEDTKILNEHPEQFAVEAAQAYLDRWQIEVFFERIKQDFALESARVRTFKRLKNLYLCVLGYAFCTDFIPSGTSCTKILKVFKDNFRQITLKMQPFLSSLRVLLEQPRLNFITGRPRKPINSLDKQMLFAF